MVCAAAACQPVAYVGVGEVLLGDDFVSLLECVHARDDGQDECVEVWSRIYALFAVFRFHAEDKRRHGETKSKETKLEISPFLESRKGGGRERHRQR